MISRNGHGRGTDFISSMPVTDFVQTTPSPPSEVIKAAEQLKYRDFLTVCLIVDPPHFVPGQLDLCSRSECQSRTYSEFQKLESGHECGRKQDKPRAGVLL